MGSSAHHRSCWVGKRPFFFLTIHLYLVVVTCFWMSSGCCLVGCLTILFQKCICTFDRQTWKFCLACRFSLSWVTVLRISFQTRHLYTFDSSNSFSSIVSVKFIVNLRNKTKTSVRNIIISIACFHATKFCHLYTTIRWFLWYRGDVMACCWRWFIQLARPESASELSNPSAWTLVVADFICLPMLSSDESGNFIYFSRLWCTTLFLPVFCFLDAERHITKFIYHHPRSVPQSQKRW